MNQPSTNKHVPRGRDNAKPPKHTKPYKKGKGKKKGQTKLRRGEPANIYLCKCHEQQAEKKPCERTPDDREAGEYSQSNLGTWHCSVTKLKCKVRRVKNKPGAEPEAKPEVNPELKESGEPNDIQ